MHVCVHTRTYVGVRTYARVRTHVCVRTYAQDGAFAVKQILIASVGGDLHEVLHVTLAVRSVLENEVDE